MGNFSAIEKDRLEILWRLRGEILGVEGPAGQDGADGLDGQPGPPGDTGPVGDGLDIYVTNDAEMVAALAELNTRGGGNIHMADGVYQQGIVVNSDNVHIIGSGKTEIAPPPATDGILFNVVNNCSVDRVTVRDVTNPGDDESDGIIIRGGSNCSVTRCHILRCDDAGISVQYDIYSYFALSDADKKDYDLTYELDGHHHLVSDNIIEDTAEGSGIEMMRCNDTLVTNNIINGASQHGIRVLGVNGCIVSDNQVHNAGAGADWYGGISIQGYGDVAPIGITKYIMDTLIDGNRVKSYQPITIFNGADVVQVSNNILENNQDHTGYVIRTIYVDDHLSPFDYDLRNMRICNNMLIGGRTSIVLQQDTVGVEIYDNLFYDFNYIGINVDANTWVSKPVTISDLYIKNNKFKPRNDATQDPKHGVYAIEAGAVANVFGNDHLPDAGYTYSDYTEAASGVINELFYSDAPSNGLEYVRKDEAWAVATGGGGGGGDNLGNIDCGDADTDNSDGYLDFGTVV